MPNCDIRIWHTLAEVELFVFLFVIKLFLNFCCSIDVLYCFAYLDLVDFLSLSGNEVLHRPMVALMSSLQQAMECSVSKTSLRRLSSVTPKSLSSVSWRISSNF